MQCCKTLTILLLLTPYKEIVFSLECCHFVFQQLAAEKTIRKHICRFKKIAAALKEKREVREMLDAEHHDIDFLTGESALSKDGQEVDSKEISLNNMYEV